MWPSSSSLERPRHINPGPDGRFHCDLGPSVPPVGLVLVALHGNSVDREIIEEPHRITSDAIDRMRSPELRQITIEPYRAAHDTQGLLSA